MASLEDFIGPSVVPLIRFLSEYVPPVVIRTTADIKDPVSLAYEAGRRSIVDELNATLRRLTEDARGKGHDPLAVRGG